MFSTYLQNRNGHYHFRLRIPCDLSGLLPQSEIVKSLKTTDLKTARSSSLQYMQGINQTFSLLRSSFISPEQAQERLWSLVGMRRRAIPVKVIKASQESNTEAISPIKTISVAAAEFISDRQESWVMKTRMETEGVFRLIADVMGDVDVTRIDRQQVRDLRDKLARLPANIYKIYPDKTPLQVWACK